MRSAPLHRQTAAGFSLVEIVLAIGVVSFAFVAILGLLPVGMEVFRSSMNDSISSQLVQRVLNEAQQTEFSVLSGGEALPAYHELISVRYFDNEGNELPANRSPESVYHLRAVVQNIPRFPDSNGENKIEMNELATVVVQVAVNPGQRSLDIDPTNLLWKSTSSVPIQSYPVLVAHHD